MKRRRWREVGVVALLIGAALVILRDQRSVSPAARSTPGTEARRLLVRPFHVDSAIHDWGRTAFEDSLAARLGAESAFVAHAGTLDAANADFVLDGSVMPDRGRYVITLQLRPAGQRTPTWTATFWRRAIADTNLVRDLAIAVNEALGPTPR